MKWTRGSRSRQSGLLLVALGTLAAIGIGLLGPHDRLLMDLAHPVANVLPEKQQTCWQSDHQLLIVTKKKGREAHDLRYGRFLYERWQGKVETLDTRTGTRVEMDGLTRLLNQLGAEPTFAADSFSCPGGNWLLWRSHVHEGQWSDSPAPSVAHLDGSHDRMWRVHNYGEAFFLDARHLLQINRAHPLVVFSDLEDPSKEKTYDTADQAQSVLAQFALRHPVDVYVEEPTGRAGRNSVLISTVPWSAFAPRLQAGRDHTNWPARTHDERRMILPQDSTFYQAVVSPQQQRILYRLQMTHPSHPFLVWMHRFVPTVAARPAEMDSLWVSRANGQGMREIGHLPDAQKKVHEYLENLQWLPDGKRVSFIYQGTLYVVPAEPE